MDNNSDDSLQARLATPIAPMIEDPMMTYLKPERIHLKNHAEYNEKWVQDRIAEDPSILGLGDISLRDRERIQPRAGRLDLLLQDPDTKRRYEVELQLGTTDERHIVRTIEYWDIERKRYPQYEHCAVLVAEDVTSRFLNVVSLFNGTIPLIVLQMQALKVADHITLVFTTVLSEMARGMVDEDEEADSEPTDRGYWEQRVGPKGSLVMVDEMLKYVQTLDPELDLKYNKRYIGLARNNQPDNFVSFKPRKVGMILDLKLKDSDEFDAIADEIGLDTLESGRRWGRYKVRLGKGEAKEHADTIRKLIQIAYVHRNS